MNAETKGDLIGWILSFSGAGLFYPILYNIWGKHNALQATKYISRGANRIYCQRGNVMIVLRNSGSHTDGEEEMETKRPLRTLVGELQEWKAREEAVAPLLRPRGTAGATQPTRR